MGIGAKKTGFVPLDSIVDIYGKEIKNLNKILTVGGRLLVEIDEISDDGERIDLTCLEIYKQSPTPPNKKKTATRKQEPTVKKKEVYDDEDDDDMYLDDDDEDENRFGYDDEW